MQALKNPKHEVHSRKPQHLPSFEELNKVLSYDADSGVFRWKERLSNRVVVGAVAGYYDPNGYRVVRVNGRNLFCHRLAWLFHFREDPLIRIDHKNGNTSDNRIINLRLATNAQNCWNMKKSRRNTSGVKGLTWDAVNLKWHVRLGHKHLGRFKVKADAVACITQARAMSHGEFANHGL
jgi:hypothetical protein